MYMQLRQLHVTVHGIPVARKFKDADKLHSGLERLHFAPSTTLKVTEVCGSDQLFGSEIEASINQETALSTGDSTSYEVLVPQDDEMCDMGVSGAPINTMTITETNVEGDLIDNIKSDRKLKIEVNQLKQEI